MSRISAIYSHSFPGVNSFITLLFIKIKIKVCCPQDGQPGGRWGRGGELLFAKQTTFRKREDNESATWLETEKQNVA